MNQLLARPAHKKIILPVFKVSPPFLPFSPPAVVGGAAATGKGGRGEGSVGFILLLLLLMLPPGRRRRAPPASPSTRALSAAALGTIFWIGSGSSVRRSMAGEVAPGRGSYYLGLILKTWYLLLLVKLYWVL